MLIDKDIRSRLIAMVSKKLDMEMMKKAIPNEVHQERIRWTLNWSRLILGRLFLELLGMREVLHGKGPQKDDVSIRELGGIPIDPSMFTDAEWGCLVKFMTHADKLAHFAYVPGQPDRTKEVDRAIPIIVKALKLCLYEKVKGHKFPLTTTEQRLLTRP